MQIRKLTIEKFRGIASLCWEPGSAFCCLIGPGDSGKSTVLDAVEATLSSRWFAFTEPDFFSCDTTSSIIIEATLGELSETLKSDERFGLYIRGWSKEGALHDEPSGDDEPVLTVRLSVDATMEPVWELVCERSEHPRTLSNRDRALFGVVRLAGEDVRHLAWGQSSVLSRLSGDTNEAAAKLAEAYKAARSSAHLGEIKALADGAELAEKFARALGAYVEGSYEPGLELGRSGLSSGSIALHDQGVPLRLAGMGTRRLATLAIQKSAISEGAIVLIDEIEHGLEPHRIIGAISQLKNDQKNAIAEKRPFGQVIMTTHSDVTLAEVGAESLRVVDTPRPNTKTALRKPSSPSPIQSLLRFTPRALLARRVLVAEGNTELGILLGIRENWPENHDGIPIEHLAVAIADGNGSQATSIALGLSSLGYHTAIYRDSDSELAEEVTKDLAAASIPVFAYKESLNTEQAMFLAATDDCVQYLLCHARNERGVGAVNDNILIKFDVLNRAAIQGPFSKWGEIGSLSSEELRQGLAEIAHRKKWFKDQRIARGLAPIVWQILSEDSASSLAIALADIETWLYG